MDAEAPANFSDKPVTFAPFTGFAQEGETQSAVSAGTKAEQAKPRDVV
jgi:hypothetical protein